MTLRLKKSYKCYFEKITILIFIVRLNYILQYNGNLTSSLMAERQKRFNSSAEETTNATTKYNILYICQVNILKFFIKN